LAGPIGLALALMPLAPLSAANGAANSASAPVSVSCQAPNLAPGYCDRDGDMVADLPEDKNRWEDPDPLVVANVPTTDLAAHPQEREAFLRYLERAIGRRVSYYVTRDYTDLLIAYREGRVHLLHLNTGSVEMEVRCHGYVPLLQALDAQGKLAGYRLEFIVPGDSKIRQMAELRGKKITFVDEKSATGYQLPRATLSREFTLEAGRDYQFEFSGRHDNSIMGVANGIYQVAPVADDVRKHLLNAKIIDPASVRVIYTSGLLPHSPWGVTHRLHPALVAKIREAFVKYRGPPWEPQNIGRYRVADYRADWQPLRDLAKAGAAGAGGQACK
jgi:phosphonate transport system substrate-binding protein